MDLNFTPAEELFRAEVRAFIDDKLPAAIQAKVAAGRPLAKEDYITWHRILHAHGWGAPNWPRQFGGTGWTSIEQFIFDEECSRAAAPPLLSFGVKMVAPVIMKFGSPAQQDRFLPRIAAAQDWWCQGYSEPGAGSDLASLKTRAVLDETRGEYVVNGQKTWTTLGQYADWIFCLVRTDASVKAQRGISFLLIDMKTPGITVRPITLLDGGKEVNEVWFEDVRVPAANLVGQENEGWTYAKFLLGHERTNLGSIGVSKRTLGRLKQIAATELRNGRALLNDPIFSHQLARVEIELMALEMTNLRLLSVDEGGKAPGAMPSILKIKGTEILQRLSELMLQAVGPYGLLSERDQGEPGHASGLAAQYCNLRKLSIFGGSNEIQKNIVAQMVLGL